MAENRIHINQETGEVGPCDATVRACPLGSEHFATVADARMHQIFGYLPDAETQKNVKNSDEFDAWATDNVDKMWEYRNHGGPKVRENLAGNIEVPTDLLWHLADDEDKNVRAKAAEHPLVTEKLFDHFMATYAATDSKLAGSLARHKSTYLRDEHVVTLAQHEVPGVRMVVAKRDRLPEGAQEVLARDAAQIVRSAVSQNQKAPLAHRIMAKEGNSFDQFHVSENTTDEETLWTLAHHPDRRIRENVLRNKAVPTDLLKKVIAEVDNEKERKVAQSTLNWRRHMVATIFGKNVDDVKL